VKVLIAPDKFKDSLTQAQAADALATGVRRARPDAALLCCPLADGGEGSADVIAVILGAQPQVVSVADPLGRRQSVAWYHNPSRALAIVEMAAASGLRCLAPSERDPLRTTSYGTGELLRAALAAGCEHILLCVGGSATVDGGAGCLQALGWQFLDAHGQQITRPITGGLLEAIAEIRPPSAPPAAVIDVLCDVDNPLLGPRGAAPVFGPQKGASAAAVAQLELGLAHWADVLTRCCGRDVRFLPRGGAAGGLPAGLAAALGARLQPGFDTLARYVDLPQKLADAQLCLTGEGCIDEQTIGGKVVAGVARLARTASVPTVAFAGMVRLPPGKTLTELAAAIGLEEIVVISPPDVSADEARRRAHEYLAAAAERVVAARG